MNDLKLAGCRAVAIAVWVTMPAAAQEEVVEVTVSGQGVTEESARLDALRKALEQGGRAEISSHSKVEDFQLIRDTIYARADGIVTDYKILGQGDAVGGLKYCRIRAMVRKSAVASTWGEVQNVLDQIGRPVIVVYIKETIDGLVQDSSILESQIEHRLLDAGFSVRAGEQVRAIADKESADAALESNVAKVQAIAKDFGAHIFITGSAQANAAGVRDLVGQATAMYNCDAMIKMYYTDTAELLASESLPNERGGARGYHTISPQAGKRALEVAGRKLVDRCYISVMRRWATRISAGGEIILEIEGVTFGDLVEIEEMLKAIDPDKIRRVNSSLTKGIARFRIQAKMTAETLARHLIKGKWRTLITIEDVKTNRIQAGKVGN